MPVTPRVSVVVPAFRAEPFIERAARGIAEQTLHDWELVIASDDGVDYGALLRERGFGDPRIRCVFTGEVGAGPARARNTGLDAARADVVATLDADDRLLPHTLAVLTPLAERHGAAYSARAVVDHATDEPLPSYDRPLPTGPVTLEDVLTSQVHSYAGIAFDRRRVRARWPATRELWEDVTFFVRCFDDIDTMFHVAEPLYVYYKRDGSICNRPETGEEYHRAAQDLLARLAKGETLGVERAASRATYGRFLRGRLAVEAAFMSDLEAGKCRDFRDFVAKRLDVFHTLPRGAPMRRTSRIDLFKEEMKFSAGHFTIFSATQRENLHGHNFTLHVELEAPIDENGMTHDYRATKRRLTELCRSLNEIVLLPTKSPHLSVREEAGRVLARFDGEEMTFLARDVRLLPIRNTTLEELASYLLGGIVSDLSGDVCAVAVRVFSGPGQSARAEWRAS